MPVTIRKTPLVEVPAGPLSFASDVKTLGIGAVLLAGTVIGSYYLIKKESKDKKQEEASANSLVYGTAENYALRLRMALKNDHWYQWWPDFASVLKTYKEIPSRSAFRQVVGKYKELYGENLETLVKDKLSQSEFAQLMEIYRRKAENTPAAKKT